MGTFESDNVVFGERSQIEGPTCYLIGAGLGAASDVFKLPTAVGFLARSFRNYVDGCERAICTRQDLPKLDQVLNIIEAEYGELSDQNLETVMTDFFVRAYGIGRAWEVDVDSQSPRRPIAELRADYSHLIAYICRRLPSFTHDSTVSCPLIRRLVESFGDSDSVITLNYDTLLEHHLYIVLNKSPNRLLRLGYVMFGAGLDGGLFDTIEKTEDYGGMFAKLHGSSDWFTCANRKCPNSRTIQGIGPWHHWSSLKSIREARCLVCGSSPRAVIVPPTAAKAFDQFPKLGLLWTRSFEGLRRASRWVLIGVSLAPTDFHLAALLRAASQGEVGEKILAGQFEICVVNKSEAGVRDVARRLKSCLDPKAAVAIADRTSKMLGFPSIDAFLDSA